ncbi:uncharacterized protein LOC120683856 [Panicum virgatum]|uniref:Uncharacterized protein n=1 Tax=Panicum virgatum TaxID=38727 RepID=A0A8T0QEC0_PANVG|nr:uncharacterized protein LOC120683856 [Panicum virgatum]KAG2568574.1 hypothetical protein PVAP13_7NG410300 [Panicum virgatum]
MGRSCCWRTDDYPCTARFRFRRLLAFLRWEYCCDKIYGVAKEWLGVIFHVEDLVAQVKAGKLQEAYQYVRSFATINDSSNEAELLAQFLQYLKAISGFSEGRIREGGLFRDWFGRIYGHPKLNTYPCFASIVADALFLRIAQLSFRSSLNWKLVCNKAAEMVEEMAYKAPDLKERMRYPRCRSDLYDVMPITSSFRGR